MSALDDLFRNCVGSYPKRPALFWEDHRITYRELSEAVDTLAGRLSGDVSAGQRVGVLAPNSPAFVIAVLAVWRCGGVAVPLNVRWREHELGHILRDAELVSLVSVDAHHRYSFADVITKLHPSLPTLRRCHFVDPLGVVKDEMSGSSTTSPDALGEDIGIILYTSGTTGMPKGSLIRDDTPVKNSAAVNSILETTPTDVCFFVLPVSHAFGLFMLLAAPRAGSQVVLVESSFSLRPVAETLGACRATILHGSPQMFSSLLNAFPRNLETVRTGLVGGTICPPSLLERLDGHGLSILNSYGMTETGPATSCKSSDSAWARHNTVGQPLPGFTFRTPDGDPGEIQVRSSYATPQYFRKPQENSASLDNGWFRTGDLGALDSHGYLHISGRSVEVIHVNGLKVFPAEVEACLATHPDVHEVVVVGAQHPTLGEAPQAFVLPRQNSNLSTKEILQFARTRIAGYKMPYAIHLVPALPRQPRASPTALRWPKCSRRRKTSKPMHVHSPLFEGLDQAALDDVFSHMRPLHFDARTHICRKGDAGSSMFVIQAGSAEVIIDDAAAGRRCVGRLLAR